MDSFASLRAMTDVDWDLLFRYYGNECTPAERKSFERWLAQDPAHRAIVDAAVMAAGRTLTKERSTVRPPRVLVARQRHAARWAWPLAAAAALLVVVGGTYIRKYSGWGSWAESPTPAFRTASTPPGSREEIRLADGTRVVLGAASTLRYPDRFGDGARDVYLTGEGYFEVVHDTAHPFRVHAAHATAEDVGTAFGVFAYPGDTAVRVVVAEGSVALGAASTGAMRRALLTPGQLGSLSVRDVVPTVKRVSVDAYLAFAHGRLAFDETPLPEVVAQLGRWYGTPFRLADTTLASRTLTASFTTESLADVLAALGPVLDVRFERVGDSVVVRAR
jgi:transmembrane sensor